MIAFSSVHNIWDFLKKYTNYKKYVRLVTPPLPSSSSPFLLVVFKIESREKMHEKALPKQYFPSENNFSPLCLPIYFQMPISTHTHTTRMACIIHNYYYYGHYYWIPQKRGGSSASLSLLRNGRSIAEMKGCVQFVWFICRGTFEQEWQQHLQACSKRRALPLNQNKMSV